jgi:arginine deiminase
MKAAIALAVLLSSGAVFSTPSSVRIQHTSIGGYDYVRLEDWARANSFQMKWLSKNDVQVSNHKTTLRFTKDSHAMVLNGVTVSAFESSRRQKRLRVHREHRCHLDDSADPLGRLAIARARR